MSSSRSLSLRGKPHFLSVLLTSAKHNTKATHTKKKEEKKGGGEGEAVLKSLLLLPEHLHCMGLFPISFGALFFIFLFISV